MFRSLVSLLLLCSALMLPAADDTLLPPRLHMYANLSALITQYDDSDFSNGTGYMLTFGIRGIDEKPMSLAFEMGVLSVGSGDYDTLQSLDIDWIELETRYLGPNEVNPGVYTDNYSTASRVSLGGAFAAGRLDFRQKWGKPYVRLGALYYQERMRFAAEHLFEYEDTTNVWRTVLYAENTLTETENGVGLLAGAGAAFDWGKTAEITLGAQYVEGGEFNASSITAGITKVFR